MSSFHSVSQLELPPPERLLPIGSLPSLVQHVRQVLGVHNCDQGECLYPFYFHRTSYEYHIVKINQANVIVN